MSKKKVAVLMGGDSAERPVSLASGRAILETIDRDRYEVVGIAWNGAMPSQGAAGDLIAGVPVLHTGSSLLLDTLLATQCDVTLIALHGGSGENGNLQAMLDRVGIRYTGSGPAASALGMDKVASKQLFMRLGIGTPRYLSFPSYASVGKCDLDEPGHERLRDAIGAELGWPVVVKPVAAGSTIGVTIVRDAAQLPGAIAEALQYDTRVLLEEFIAGAELTAGLLSDGDQVIALPLIEIVPHGASGFFDYEAKYSSGGAAHIIPPRLAEEVQERVRELAVSAYRALGCRGVARADFKVRDAQPYLLEINTVPGMTATSLVPDAARALGISFSQLIDRLIDDALLV